MYRCFLFTALTYAELSARYPLSAGLALYINAGFRNSYLATFVGLTIAISGLLSAATLLNGFYSYLSIFIQIPEIIIILIVVIFISTIAITMVLSSSSVSH